MGNEITETFETLDAINYQDLKAKFIELGIESAWKGGAKKTDLINKALTMLDDIKNGMDLTEEKPELEEPVLEKPEDEEPALEKAEDEEPAVEKPESEEAIKEKEVKEVEFDYSDLSKEVLEKALRQTNSNLKNNVAGQQSILLKKMTALEAALAEKE